MNNENNPKIRFFAVIGYASSEPLSRGGGIKVTLELPENYSLELAQIHEIKRHMQGVKVTLQPVEMDKVVPEKPAKITKRSRFFLKQSNTKEE